MKAILRAIRITPKKANLVAGMVRKKSAPEALTILKYTPKKAAKLLHKLLASAIANAVNNFKQDEASLIVKEVIVTKGATFKRGVPVSRGRVYPILKRTSNITVILEISEDAVKPAAKKTADKSKTTDSTAGEEKVITKETKKVKKPAKKSTK